LNILIARPVDCPSVGLIHSAQKHQWLDQPHPISHIDDFGGVMVTLGEHEEALGPTWHVRDDKPKITRQDFGEMIFRELDKPARISGTGRVPMWIAALFIRGARQSVEMMYEFENPFAVDSSKFEQAFDFQPIPMQEGIG
jgi:nucleoside-diphosphate-sugar epimerase